MQIVQGGRDLMSPPTSSPKLGEDGATLTGNELGENLSVISYESMWTQAMFAYDFYTILTNPPSDWNSSIKLVICQADLVP